MHPTTILAFSGGLDTSYCAKYLTNELNHEVHAVFVHTGGFSQKELDDIEAQAHKLGVHKYQCIDVQNEFYNKGIRYLIYGNVLRNGTYPLSVSAERVFQAMAIAKYANKIGADYIAHGSTGAGNDQVRFDMVFQILAPTVNIITPIRDQQLSREQEVNYLAQCGVLWDEQKAQYSINQGLWGTSVGGAETLTSHLDLPEEAWPTQITKTKPEEVVLGFAEGELVEINEQYFDNPIEAIETFQAIAAPFGIGRDVHIGDTIIGIKGRVGFEAAAPLIIVKAHQALEKHTLSKWQLQWKEQWASWYGNLLHEGQYLEPAMRDVEAFLESSQQRVTGVVKVKLAAQRFEVIGIQSPFDLMQVHGGGYGEETNGWTGEDVKGFTKIAAQAMKLYHSVPAVAETQKVEL